jgi:hypothetical protein
MGQISVDGRPDCQASLDGIFCRSRMDLSETSSTSALPAWTRIRNLPKE